MRVCVCVSVSVRVGDCGCRCVDDVVICSSRRGARCVTALPWCFVCCVLPLTCTAHVCHPPSAPLPLPLQDDICGLIDKCTENEVLTSAEAMVSSGMHSLGYEWIWLGPSVMTVSVILSHSVSFCLSLSLFVSLSLSLSLSHSVTLLRVGGRCLIIPSHRRLLGGHGSRLPEPAAGQPEAVPQRHETRR